MCKKFNIVLILLVFTINLFSQESRFNDTIDCTIGTIYRSKSISFEENRDIWRFMIKNCPDYSKQTYLDGEKIFRHFIEIERDSVERERLIDTLLLNFDLRLRYFGDTLQVYSKKATAIIKYRQQDLGLAYDLLNESIMLEPSGLISRYITFMNLSKFLLDKGQLSYAQFNHNYDYSVNQLKEHLKRTNDPIRQDNIARSLDRIVKLKD